MAKAKFGDFGSAMKNKLTNDAGDELRKLEASVKGFEKTIPWEEMRPSEDNKYETKRAKIDEIKESIKRFGILFYNLIVIPIEEENYKYKILAGETRHKAIGELLDEGDKTFVPGIRCIVINKDTPIVDQKIIIEETNLIQRDYDAKTKSEAMARLRDLYKEKNEKDGTNNSITKQIAEQTGIGERQVQKYLSLDKLIPDLKAYFDESKITIDKAAQFANLSEADQMIVVELLRQNSDASKKEVERVKEEIKIREESLHEKINALENEIKSVADINNSLKRDLEEKENEIADKVSKEMQLRKEIEEELQSVNPDKDKIKNLELNIKVLNEDKESVELERDQFKKQLNQADVELKNLKKNLLKAEEDKKEAGKLQLLPEEKERLKEEFDLENIMEQVRKDLVQLYVKGEKYKNKFKNDIVSTYYEELIKKINADVKKITKGGE